MKGTIFKKWWLSPNQNLPVINPLKIPDHLFPKWKEKIKGPYNIEVTNYQKIRGKIHGLGIKETNFLNLWSVDFQKSSSMLNLTRGSQLDKYGINKLAQKKIEQRPLMISHKLTLTLMDSSFQKMVIAYVCRPLWVGGEENRPILNIITIETPKL